MKKMSIKKLITLAVPLALVAGCTQNASVKENASTKENISTMKKQEKEKNIMPIVIIETSLGTIKAELFEDKAPITVANFLSYVDKGFYDGTIFHRVISGFMIQGGGFTEELRQKPTEAPIKNEARSDVPNDRGTLAMARTDVVDSATAQFFINHKDNDFLTHKDTTPRGYGYAVFGKVVEGMEVVDKIARVETTARPPFRSDVPEIPIFIRSVTRATK